MARRPSPTRPADSPGGRGRASSSLAESPEERREESRSDERREQNRPIRVRRLAARPGPPRSAPPGSRTGRPRDGSPGARRRRGRSRPPGPSRPRTGRSVQSGRRRPGLHALRHREDQGAQEDRQRDDVRVKIAPEETEPGNSLIAPAITRDGWNQSRGSSRPRSAHWRIHSRFPAPRRRSAAMTPPRGAR